MFSALEQFDIIVIFDNLNMTILNNIVIVLIFGIFFFFKFSSMSLLYLIPKFKIQQINENILMFIFSLVYKQIGNWGKFYFPFLLVLFIYIVLLNFISFIPYSLALTTHIIWTIYLSMSLVLGIFFVGLRNYGLEFLEIFVPDMPKTMYPIIVPLEVFSYVLRSISLSLRLSANILAGHTLLHILTGLISVLFVILYELAFVLLLLLFAITILELVMAILQGYIFVLLCCIYLNDSINGVRH